MPVGSGRDPEIGVDQVVPSTDTDTLTFCRQKISIFGEFFLISL
jgi:hypothetical protein